MGRWVKNFETLAKTSLRADALSIFEEGLTAIDTARVMEEELRWDPAARTLCVKGLKVCFSDYERVFFVAVGKCAVAAARSAERVFGDGLAGGFVLDIQSGVFQKLTSLVGTHPFPTEANVAATNDIINLFKQATERDLIIAVISGGGSSLLCNPYEIACEALTSIISSLVKSGADICEVNTVRKHFSRVQGGQLAKIAYPARVIGLVFSDVIGDDVSVIASGPLTKDQTTKEDAVKILEKYETLKQCRLPDCEVLETPKDDVYFERVNVVVVVNNERALEAMKRRAETLGYRVLVKTRILSGEASTVGNTIAREGIGEKEVLLFGGETTVTVRHAGEGGRNQELALAALPFMERDRLVLAAASDGMDNGDMAGAIADHFSRQRAGELNLNPADFLQKNDSYHFWKSVGAHINTGITGSNVSDLVIFARG